jgi:hypothetical protein
LPADNSDYRALKKRKDRLSYATAPFIIVVAIAAMVVSLWAFANRPEEEPAWSSRIQGFSFSPMRSGYNPLIASIRGGDADRQPHPGHTRPQFVMLEARFAKLEESVCHPNSSGRHRNDKILKR